MRMEKQAGAGSCPCRPGLGFGSSECVGGKSLEASNRRMTAADWLSGSLTLPAVKCREQVWKREPSKEATEGVQVAVMVVGTWMVAADMVRGGQT